LVFVLEHSAISSAIIGPGTKLETQLGAPDISLNREILDAIDALVPPGTSVAQRELGCDCPSNTNATLTPSLGSTALAHECAPAPGQMDRTNALAGARNDATRKDAHS
jgi:hypothetical protein